MSRRRPAMRTSALVAGVLFVLVAPAEAQQGAPAPIAAPIPVLDDEGEVADQLTTTEDQLAATRRQLQHRLREAWMHGGQLSSGRSSRTTTSWSRTTCAAAFGVIGMVRP